MICSKVKTNISIFVKNYSPRFLLSLLLLPLLTSCAGVTNKQSTSHSLFSSPVPAGFQEIHSPAFAISNPKKQYNLIGTPSVQLQAQGPEVIVDPAQPTIYFESQTFSTHKDSYKNLIYRIHFEKVPFSFTELHLTTGRNPGLLVIYTLDKEDRLLLITTLHSCGCYLAFFPTDNLPQKAYPKNWPKIEQDVYGYSLPNLIRLASQPPSGKIFFTLESGNHRISDAEFIETDTPIHNANTTLMMMSPMSTLHHLPSHDTTVSFFEEQGPRKGYVKNNIKILERILISWWAFDLRVGQDKAFGKDDDSNIPLYTSLKFWQRNASDLKNFPRFLSYWGWDL